MKSLRQSPTDPAFVQNPYPFYDRMRAAGRLVWWEDYAMPMASHHADITALLRDRRLGRAPLAPIEIPPHLQDFYAIEAHSMLELEPPHHTHLRGQVLRAFTSRAIQALRPEIETLCARLTDAFPQGPFDILDAYARPLPVQIIARFMGVPVADADQLLAWSNAMVKMYQASRTEEDERAADGAARDFSAYLAEQIAAKRQKPGDGLISTLINAGTLEEPALISTCVLLLNAGHEATVHTLGNALKTLLETGIRPSPEPAFVEEVLRHDPPLHLFTRWVYEDLSVGPHELKRGDQIGLLLAAGNHDPTVYPEPRKFRSDRPAKPVNVSFGAGLHFCIGAALARLELQIALTHLFAAYPDIRLHSTPQYADVYHFHGLKALEVRV